MFFHVKELLFIFEVTHGWVSRYLSDPKLVTSIIISLLWFVTWFRHDVLGIE